MILIIANILDDNSAIPHLELLFDYYLRSFAMSLREKHFIDYSAENR